MGQIFLLFIFTVQEMRQQMGGLQSQLQQVQLERSTLQSRLKTSQAEIDSLRQVRQWYQQQLALAQEARVRLQSEMANMQVRLILKQWFYIHGLVFVCMHVTYWVFLPFPGWTDDSDWCPGTFEARECDTVSPTYGDPTPIYQGKRANCCSAAEYWGIFTNIPVSIHHYGVWMLSPKHIYV